MILDQWARERPDLDCSSMAIFGRLSRIYEHIQSRYRQGVMPYDLNPGEFDVLATLRRAGDSYTLTAGELTQSLMVTGGAVTNRIDRLVAKGLVDRREDPANRRSVLISLTADGLALIDTLVVEHVNRQQDMLHELSLAERQQLADLLRKLLHRFEP